MKTARDMELGWTGARRARAARDRGAPCAYGSRGARGGLKLEDIAEGVAGLVLDGDHGPVEGRCDFGKHGRRVGMQASCSLPHSSLEYEEGGGGGKRKKSRERVRNVLRNTDTLHVVQTPDETRRVTRQAVRSGPSYDSSPQALH